MGRDKEPNLSEKLLLLIEENRFEEALATAKLMNSDDYIRSLSPQEAEKLYLFIGELQRRLSLKKEEISSAIEVRNKVKKTYLW